MMKIGTCRVIFHWWFLFKCGYSNIFRWWSFNGRFFLKRWRSSIHVVLNFSPSTFMYVLFQLSNGLFVVGKTINVCFSFGWVFPSRFTQLVTTWASAIINLVHYICLLSILDLETNTVLCRDLFCLTYV